MKNVTPKMAEACEKAFALQQKTAKGSLTTAVGFDSKKLQKWLQKVAPHSAEIQVRFGIYTAEYAPTKKMAGRTTVFFCACNEDGSPATDEDGDEIPPVNQGNNYP